jgi:undecaprenyl-diphosphatase
MYRVIFMENFILLLKYIFLGLIQGFTEPLPISSSGHLVIFQELFNLSIEGINFEIIVNTGSLIAIIIIFYKDIVSLVKNTILFLFKKQVEYKKDFLYVLMLIVAVIPAGLFGFIFKDSFDKFSDNLWVVGVSLIITALALSLVGKASVENTTEEITFKDALVIGIFQIFSLVPGISRSGSTMVGGLSRKIKFEDVMKFSFLLYIPISIAASLLSILDLSTSNDTFIIGYVAAFMVSIIATYFAVKWLFKMVRKGNLKYFSIYCFTVGTIVLISKIIIEVI